MRFPAKLFADASATLPAHFFQDRLRPRLNKHSRHMLSKLCRLIRGSGSALLYVLHSVHGTHARIQQEFTALDASPRAQWNLAPTLQCRQQRSFRNDRGSRLHIIQRRQ
jgi:hypothetical protein